MQRLIVAALLGQAAANNVVSPASKKCLDIKLMCKDCDATVGPDDADYATSGCDRDGCDREEPTDVKKGARLHMWECHDDENQDFELVGGRAMNKAAGSELCVDIKAMCEDGTDVDGCTRQSLDDIKASAEDGKEVEIQLYTCRDDSSESSSFGNQKWDLLSGGLWKNEGTGLCLVAHLDDEESGADATNGAKVHVHKCPTEADDDFVFDFETGDMAAATNAAGDDAAGGNATRLRRFSVGAVAEAEPRSPTPAPIAAACALGLAGAAAAAFVARARRSGPGGGAGAQLPLCAE